MNDIMLDIETMGTQPGSAIVAIGAVEFSLSEMKTGEVFYTKISLDSCTKVGLTIDAGTVLWWLKKSDDARRELNGITPIEQALLSFRDFLWKCAPADEVKLWAKGPSFDNVLLSAAYRACDIDLPWRYWNDRCMRTMTGMFPSIQPPPRKGVQHNALDDAVYQAETLINIKRTLNERKQHTQ